MPAGASEYLTSIATKALRPCGVVQRSRTSKAVWSAVKRGWPRPGECSKRTSGDFADEIGDQPAHDGGGEGEVLLERPEEIEDQCLAGEQIVPEALDVDDGADFAVGDFVLDEGDQGRVDQVDAALADAVGDHAAEAAGAAVGVDIAAAGVAVLLAPQALAQPGTERKRVSFGFGAVIAA